MGVPELPDFTPAENVRTKYSDAFQTYPTACLGAAGARAANFSSGAKWVANTHKTRIHRSKEFAKPKLKSRVT